MQHTACKHKQMPYKMHIFMFCFVKNYSQSVAQSAQHQKRKSGFIHHCQKRLYAEYRQAQNDMREAIAVKANIDHLVGNTPDGRNKEQER